MLKGTPLSSKPTSNSTPVNDTGIDKFAQKSLECFGQSLCEGATSSSSCINSFSSFLEIDSVIDRFGEINNNASDTITTTAIINICSFRVGTFTAVFSLEPKIRVSTRFQNSCSALPSSCTEITSVLPLGQLFKKRLNTWPPTNSKKLKCTLILTWNLSVT